MIRLDKITKRYGDRKILDDFSLHIKDNEFIAITGESGCGKSTLLNIMGLIEHYNSGSVMLNGIKNMKVNSSSSLRFIRYNINYLFQNYALVDDQTVAYNLNLGAKFIPGTRLHRKLSVNNALKEVGLAGFEKKKIFQLSGGEQQRVALARAMLKPGNIVFADEPTGSLDQENKQIVLEHIKKMQNDGKTVVVVTHDPFVSSYADRIIKLKISRGTVLGDL